MLSAAVFRYATPARDGKSRSREESSSIVRSNTRAPALASVASAVRPRLKFPIEILAERKSLRMGLPLQLALRHRQHLGPHLDARKRNCSAWRHDFVRRKVLRRRWRD